MWARHRWNGNTTGQDAQASDTRMSPGETAWKRRLATWCKTRSCCQLCRQSGAKTCPSTDRYLVVPIVRSSSKHTRLRLWIRTTCRICVYFASLSVVWTLHLRGNNQQMATSQTLFVETRHCLASPNYLSRIAVSPLRERLDSRIVSTSLSLLSLRPANTTSAIISCCPPLRTYPLAHPSTSEPNTEISG